MGDMRPCLYTFGCSYTQDFEKLNSIDIQMTYVNEFLNGITPPSWPIVLSNLLLYDVVNSAIGGNDNETIFEDVCKLSPKFKKGDMVIIQWTQNHRFRWPSYNEENKWVRQLPNWYLEMPTLSKSTFDEVVVIRDHRLYRQQLYNQQTLLEQLSSSVGFDIFYWSMASNLLVTELPKDKKYLLSDKLKPKYCHYSEYFDTMKVHTIAKETNGVINDGHYGKTGHEVIGKLFYDHIISDFN